MKLQGAVAVAAVEEAATPTVAMPAASAAREGTVGTPTSPRTGLCLRLLGLDGRPLPQLLLLSSCLHRSYLR